MTHMPSPATSVLTSFRASWPVCVPAGERFPMTTNHPLCGGTSDGGPIAATSSGLRLGVAAPPFVRVRVGLHPGPHLGTHATAAGFPKSPRRALPTCVFQGADVASRYSILGKAMPARTTTRSLQWGASFWEPRRASSVDIRRSPHGHSSPSPFQRMLLALTTSRVERMAVWRDAPPNTRYRVARPVKFHRKDNRVIPDPFAEIYEALVHAIEQLEELNRGERRSRELSLAITNLQTGVLWLGAAPIAPEGER